MRKLGIQSCVLATMMLFILAPGAEAKSPASAAVASSPAADNAAREASERLLADKVKAEEQSTRQDKQAAEEKARLDKLERAEKRREAEEQRIKDKKDRERECQIRPVMSDAQIAKCHEVWR